MGATVFPWPAGGQRRGRLGRAVRIAATRASEGGGLARLLQPRPAVSSFSSTVSDGSGCMGVAQGHNFHARVPFS